VSLQALPLQSSPLVPPALLEPPRRSESRGILRDLAGLLLDRHLRRLSRLRNPVEWRMARLLERLDDGSGYLDLGFARLSDYATERLGLTSRRVQTLLGLARRLGPLPRVAAAYESGRLSQSQAALLARVANPSDEARWVARAASLTVRRLTQEVRAALRETERGGEAGLPDDGATAILGDEEDAGGTLGFTGPAGLRPLWDEALELARRSGGAEEPVHRCAEFIAADFLAGVPDLPRVLAAEVADDHADRVLGRPGPDESGREGTDLFEAVLGAIEAEATNTPGFPSAEDGLAASLPDAVIEGLNDTPRLVDLRLRELVASRQNLAWHQGRLLRIMAGRRLYRDLGFLSFSRYCQERVGLGARRAWQLIALDRRLVQLPRLTAAYRAGDVSWVRASAIAGVATEATEEDWIRLARSVTVRRLREEVALAVAFEAGAAAGAAEGVRDAGSFQGVRPPGLGPDGRVQLSAPRAAPARAAAAGTGGGIPDREGVHGGGSQVHIRFWAPLGTVSLWRQAVAVSRLLILRERAAAGSVPAGGNPAEWQCVERMLRVFVAGSSVRQTPAWQRRYRIFERDGWRCRVPGCSSRANLQVHHVVFRSRGGGEDDGNLATLCATHHLRGLHQGRLRCHALPDGLLAWEFAPDPVDGAHLRYVEDVTWEAAMGSPADGPGPRRADLPASLT
jgi:hypothetical protein